LNDGDGKLDLLLGSGSGKVVWYRNVGTAAKPELALAGTLVEAAPQKKPADPRPTRSGMTVKIFVTDWDGDGRPDLLVGDDNNVGGAGGNNEYPAPPACFTPAQPPTSVGAVFAGKSAPRLTTPDLGAPRRHEVFPLDGQRVGPFLRRVLARLAIGRIAGRGAHWPAGLRSGCVRA
jgi:hypothetical protein